jgi:hypothetical protein
MLQLLGQIKLIDFLAIGSYRLSNVLGRTNQVAKMN